MVVHCKKDKYNVYIGGQKDILFHYGNPFSHKEDTIASLKVESREIAIDNFRKWLLKEDFLDLEPKRRDWILSMLPQLKDKVLGCWCKPQSCHGDVLLELINKLD